MRWVMRWLLRMLVASGSLFVVLMAVQGAYWYRTLTAPFEIRQAEAVVVFLGGPGRIRKGYDLTNQGWRRCSACRRPMSAVSPGGTRGLAPGTC